MYIYQNYKLCYVYVLKIVSRLKEFNFNNQPSVQANLRLVTTLLPYLNILT